MSSLVGFAKKSVNSWNGDFVKRVSLQRSGVRNPYVFIKQSNVACHKKTTESTSVRNGVVIQISYYISKVGLYINKPYTINQIDFGTQPMFL